MIRFLSFLAAVAVATVLLGAFFGGLLGGDGSVRPRGWRAQDVPVSYCVNTSEIGRTAEGAAVVSEERFVELVRLAFQEWEEAVTSAVAAAVDSAVDSAVAFAYVGTCSSAVANNDDGVNTVGWGPAAQPNEQWGETFWRLDDRWIEEADVRLNTVFEWDEARLQSVLRHETGHVLGLTHSTDPEAAMNPAKCNCNTELSADDRRRARELSGVGE